MANGHGHQWGLEEILSLIRLSEPAYVGTRSFLGHIAGGRGERRNRRD